METKKSEYTPQQMVDFMNSLSEEQVEELLKKKTDKSKKDYEKRKQQYEKYRNEMVAEMVGQAKDLQTQMIADKNKWAVRMEAFAEKAKKYGDIRNTSKGGYSLRSADGTQRVVYRRNVKCEFDERITMAIENIKEFLEDKVKKKDIKYYKLISGLLQKNKAGDFTPALVLKLKEYENLFDDVRWRKGIELMQESYREVAVSYSLEFYEKDENDKDQQIILTLTSL